MQITSTMLCKLISVLTIIGLAKCASLPTAQLTKITFEDYDLKNLPKLQKIANDLILHQNALVAPPKEALLNDYMDNDFIPSLNKYIQMNRLEPQSLPGFTSDFKWTIFSGKIRLFNGRLWGLSSLRRTGDVLLSYEYPNLIVRIPVGFGNLHFDYDYELKFMSVGPDGRVDGKSQGNSFAVEININMASTRVSLRTFIVDTLGSVDVEFSESALIDWLINLLADLITPIVKPTLKGVLEDTITQFLESVIALLNTIICTILNNCT